MRSRRADDRYYVTDREEKAGHLSTVAVWSGLRHAGVADDWTGLRCELHFSDAADVRVFPVETVSQSEDGFELIYQSSVMLPCWRMKLDAGEQWSQTIRVELS